MKRSLSSASLILASFALAAPAEMVRLNIGTRTPDMVDQVLSRVATHHAGELVRSFTHRRFLTVAVPAEGVGAALADPRLAELTRYIERDRVVTIPE